MESAPLRLRLHLGDVHAQHLHAEQLLDRLPDLRLVRIRVDAERVRVAPLDLRVALLRHDRGKQDFVGMQAHQEAFAFTRSSASWVTSTERAQRSAATSSSPGVTTTARSAACCESTARSAERRALRFTFTSKSRGVGGNATPPPVQCGARVVPARARPVPFWRHGFARPPATSPRLLAARVPEREAFISARTVSCTTYGFTSAAKTDSSRVTSFDVLPAESSNGALGAAISVPPPALRRSRSSAQGQRP